MLQSLESAARGHPHGIARQLDGYAQERMIAQGRLLRAQLVRSIVLGAVRGVARLLAQVVRPARCKRSRGRTSHALAGLNDRMLTDIGVRRADLHAHVYARAPLSRIKRAA